METVRTVWPDPNGNCPPGYHIVVTGDILADWYCELDSTPTPSPVPQVIDSGPPIVKPIVITVTPAFQASNADVPDLEPQLEVVQYCANPGAELGGVNITFASDSSLLVEDWFSEKPGHVKCVDNVSNPRICWGPQATTFEVLLCNTDFVQNDVYVCKPLPVTLGSCESPRDDPQPAPTSCGHC